MDLRVQNGDAGAIKSIHAVGSAAVQVAFVDQHIIAAVEHNHAALAGIRSFGVPDGNSANRDLFAIAEIKNIGRTRLSQNLRALSEYGEIGAVFYAEFILVSESVVVPDEHPVRFRYLASGKQHQSFAFS